MAEMHANLCVAKWDQFGLISEGGGMTEKLYKITVARSVSKLDPV